MSAADVVRRLLSALLEFEWTGRLERCPRSCCNKWYVKCSTCDAHQGADGHKPGCELRASIDEAEAFLLQEAPGGG